MIVSEKKKVFGRKGVKEFKKSFDWSEKEDARQDIINCINDFKKYLSTHDYKMQAWEKDWIEELKRLEKEVYEIHLKNYYYKISIA